VRATPRLILICGLPAAGKTTRARRFRLEREQPAVRLSPWARASRWSMASGGAAVVLRGLDVPLEELWRLLEQRNAERARRPITKPPIGGDSPTGGATVVRVAQV